jgi:hypothetical protein
MNKAYKEKQISELYQLAHHITEQFRKYNRIKAFCPEFLEEKEIHINGLLTLYIGTATSLKEPERYHYLHYMAMMTKIHGERIEFLKQWKELFEKEQKKRL